MTRAPQTTVIHVHRCANRLLALWALICLVCGLPGSLQAQQVTLLADLFTGPNGASGGSVFAAVGFDGRSFFVSGSRENGQELWITDGTPAGTALFADICPGRCSSSPTNFSVVGGRLFFSAFDSLHGHELWMLASANSQPVLFADINPGIENGFPGKVSRVQFRVNSTTVTRDFVIARRADTGRELWRVGSNAVSLEFDLTSGASDGLEITPVGFGNDRLLALGLNAERRRTPVVLNYSSTTGPPVGVSALSGFPTVDGSRNLRNELVRLADKTYLRELGIGAIQDRIWIVSDTTASASLVIERSSLGEVISNPALFRVFFTANSTLHVSDGTPGGTVSLGVSSPSELTVRGNRLLFLAASGSSANIELFSSDGTPAGTGLLKEIVAGTTGIGDDAVIRATADSLRALITTPTELWISDGTTAGTVRLDTFPDGEIRRLFPTIGRSALLADQGSEPHFTAGQSNDIRRIAETIVDVGHSFARPHGHIGDRLVLNAALDGGSGFSVTLAMDGRDGSAREVLHTSSSLSTRNLRLGNRLLIQPSSRTLMSTNGHAAGTTIFDTPRLILGDGCGIRIGNTLVTHGDDSNGTDQVWSTDGTAQGSFDLTEVDNVFFEICLPRTSSNRIDHAALGDRFLFSAIDSDDSFGQELMGLNGSGVFGVIADINPGSESSLPLYFERLGDAVLFAADDGLHGRELWTTDGTAQGTRLLLDIEPGSAGSQPFGLWRVGSHVIFGTRTQAHGTEMWTTDGTGAGTRLLRDVFSGPGSSIAEAPSGDIAPSAILSARGALAVFSAAPDDLGIDRGCPLFMTDGTPEGTQCAQDRSLPVPIAPFAPAREARITDSGDVVFIASMLGMGEEIFALRDRNLLALTGNDIRPGPGNSGVASLVLDQDVVWFSADDGQTGIELYRLDLGDPDRIFRDGVDLP